MGTYPPQVWRDRAVVLRGNSRRALAPRTPGNQQSLRGGWGFHTLLGGIDPGDLRFRPRVVGVIEIWKYFESGDEKLSSPGVAGPRRCPERQLSLRTGSMSLS